MPREARNTYRASTHTRVLVAFYTDEANGLHLPEPVQTHPRLGTIVGFTTSKSLGPASGQWTLTIKKPAGPRSALRDLWRDPEDVWVRIKVMVDGQIIDTMLGLVDSVGEDTARSGMGQRAETYTISGRDFGKVFESTELFVNFFHRPEDALRSAGALTATFLEKIIGTPEHFVRVLLEEWVGNSGTAEAQWMLPAGLGAGSFYRSLLEGGRVRGIERMDRLVNGEAISPSLFQVDQTGGKLWDVLQEYSNGIMNELFVDLGPSTGAGLRDLETLVPKVYLRERPFPTRSSDGRTTSHTKWDQLRTHVLEPDDVKRRQIAKGGAAHRFNYWLIQLEGIGTEGFNVAEILQRGVDGVPYGHPGNIPIYNTESIQKHGLRRYLATTRFIPFQEGLPDLENFFRLCAAWLKKLHDWYVVAPLELSGRIETTRIMPEIRIGERVEERRAEGTITYYVESVEHRYEYPGPGSTTLTLTRGEYDDDDLLAYVYEQYDNPRALTERERCFIPPDADIDETLDLLAEGCGFETPTGDVVGFTSREEDLGIVEGEDFTVDDGSTQRTLEAERDGSSPRAAEPDAPAIEDPGMQRTLDDTDTNVGTAEEVPTPNETTPERGEPVLDRGTLERGEPIESVDEFTDPIEGLEDAGF